MRNIFLFFIIITPIIKSIKCGQLGNALGMANQAVTISADLKTLSIPPIKINNYLNNFEKMKRDEINLNAFLDTYSLKNPHFTNIDFPNKNHKDPPIWQYFVGGFFTAIPSIVRKIDNTKIDNNEERKKYFDLYNQTVEILKKWHTNFSFNKDKKVRWYQIDKIIEAVEITLNKISEDRQIYHIDNALNTARGNTIEIFYDYQRENIFLKELINILTESENNLKTIMKKQNDFFEDIQNKKIDIDQSEEIFLICNCLLESEILIEYKNKIYNEMEQNYKNITQNLENKYKATIGFLSDTNSIFKNNTNQKPIKYTIEQAGKNNTRIQKVGEILSKEIVN